MSYEIRTKINDRVISIATFDGRIDNPEITTIKPVKAADRDYYYFIINNNPIKAKPTDIMTIEQRNVD